MGVLGSLKLQKDQRSILVVNTEQAHRDNERRLLIHGKAPTTYHRASVVEEEEKKGEPSMNAKERSMAQGNGSSERENESEKCMELSLMG